MRFRRRADEVPDASGASAVGEPPVATFAGVLDGRRLWLAVDARPGRLTLRTDAGELLELVDELIDEPPSRHLAARLDLVALSPHPTTYDVVLVAPDGRTAPVHTQPLPPSRVPAAPGGRARHLLERGDDGALRLRTEPLEASVELAGIEAGPDGIRLTVDGPITQPITLLTDGSVAASWPTDLLDDAALTGVPAGPTRVVVGPGQLPVRRRADDVPDPGRGVPLPGTDRLRLRWTPDGLLQARVLDAPDGSPGNTGGGPA